MMRLTTAAKIAYYSGSTKKFISKTCIFNYFYLSLQLNNRKSMTVKANGTPTNHLNINEIEQNTPPPILLN